MSNKNKSQNSNRNWREVNNLREIGIFLRHKRKEMGLTQSEAAGLCNVGVRFISDMENGKSTMHFDKVFKVLKRFGILIGISERA
jgi:HTH-type transcriptional regulator / antitoxin HipB